MGNGFTAPIEVEFRATGVEGVRNGLRLVKHEAEEMSHSTLIGLGELTRGLTRIGESGEASAFALKELSGASMRLGTALGPVGGLIGIVTLVGGAFYEAFSKAREEMKKTREQFEQDIGKMANAGQSADLQRKLKDLLYGTPYDAKGQLRNPTNTPGVFQGSLTDLRSRIAMLNGQIANPAGDNPIARYGNFVKAQNALNDLKKLYGYDALEGQAAQLTTAIMNLASQPASMSSLLGMHVKEISPDAAMKNDARVQRLIDFANGVATHEQLQAMGVQFLGGVGGAGPLLGGTARILGAKGPTVAKLTESVGEILADAKVKIIKQIDTDFTHGIEDALVNGLQEAFSGQGLTGLGKGFLKGLLDVLGDIAIQLGEAMIPIGAWLESFTTALLTLNGPAAIAAGLGLILAGGALKAGASAIGHSGGGHGGSSSYSAPTQIIDRGSINPVMSAASSLTVRTPVALTVIGERDPVAQSSLLRMISNAQKRGGVS